VVVEVVGSAPPRVFGYCAAAPSFQTNSKPKTQVQPKLGRRHLFFFLRAHQTTQVSLKKKIKQRKCSFTRYCKKCSFTIPREKSVRLQSQAESDSTEVILKLVLGKMLGGTIQQPLMRTVLRETNKVAHSLASFGFSNKFDCNWVDEPPSVILDDLLNDVIFVGNQ
jgi:hypothetical protein